MQDEEKLPLAREELIELGRNRTRSGLPAGLVLLGVILAVTIYWCSPVDLMPGLPFDDLLMTVIGGLIYLRQIGKI